MIDYKVFRSPDGYDMIIRRIEKREKVIDFRHGENFYRIETVKKYLDSQKPLSPICQIDDLNLLVDNLYKN